MSGFFVSFGTSRVVATGERHPMGYRVAYITPDGRGSCVYLGKGFVRQRDAEAAMNALNKEGITPEEIGPALSLRSEAFQHRIRLIMAEALQW